MNFNILPTVTFTPTAGSFPFSPKRLFLSQNVKVPLEAQTSRQASPDNGIFLPGSASLSAPHAEVWIQGKHVSLFLFAWSYTIYASCHYSLLGYNSGPRLIIWYTGERSSHRKPDSIARR